MHRTTALLLSITAIFSAACGGKSYTADKLGVDEAAPVTFEYTDDDVRTMFEKKSQLTAPFRMGVFFAGKWESADIDRVLALEESLRECGLVEKLFYVSPATLSNQAIGSHEGPINEHERRAIRLAAARYKADAVLVLRSTDKVETSANFLAITYPALVTGLFVPGDDVSADSSINGMLWDVRNDNLYLGVDVDGSHKTVTSPWLREERKGITAKAARTAALEEFEGELLRTARALAP